MRVRCRLLDESGSAVPVEGLTGSVWQARLEWRCSDGPLDLRVLAAEPVELPDAEPSEPVAGAIARVVAATRGSHALLLLANPAAALGAERIALADGVRLFAIASEADLACWDAALALGVPVYGVRGTVVTDLVGARPANLLSALAYGGALCCEGLEPVALLEDRAGVRWTLPEDGEGAVIVRQGFEVARIAGREGAWVDRGSEAYVRVELSTPAGRCWTQPRFIAPRRA
jgi:hypothetical protein